MPITFTTAEPVLAPELLEMQGRLRAHSFLTDCRNGKAPMSRLKIFLSQHAAYSGYFVQYLCALIANLSNQDDVRLLLENLGEEMGCGSAEGESHYKIYCQMLETFGIDARRTEVLPSTKGLIDKMFSCCRDPDSAYGLGALCLGAEAVAPIIYEDIICGFRAHGIPDKQIRFFHLHVGRDSGHAEAMMLIISRMMRTDPAATKKVLSAALAVIDARLTFFDGVKEAGI